MSASAPAPARAPRFPQLDGLRGLAALAVVVAHFNPRTFGVMPAAADSLVARALGLVARFAIGNLAVAAFFALSAFLLTYRARFEHQSTGSFSIGHFIRRRCLRIWPLYFVAVASAFWAYSRPDISIAVFDVRPETWQWIKSHRWLYFSFVSNWSLAINYMGGYVDPSPGPLRILWSVAAEEQFYLVYPFLISIIFRSPRAGVPIAAGVSALGWTFRLIFVHLPVHLATMGSAGGMYYATLPYADVFIAGAFAGWLIAGEREPRPPREGGWGIGWLALALLLGRIWSGRLWFPYAFPASLLYTLNAVVFAGLIQWLARAKNNWCGRLLASSPLVFVGRISFGIYVWHIVVNALIAYWLGHFRQGIVCSDLAAMSCLVLSIGGTIMLATGSYLLVEKPFLRPSWR